MVNVAIFLIALLLRIVLVNSDIPNDIANLKHDCILNITELVEVYEMERVCEIEFEEERWTGAALVLNCTNKEHIANEIFMKFKLEELHKYRNVTSENPAAMHFYDAKDKIEESKVYQIIKKMPKGANLYIQSLGSVSSDWIIKNLSRIDGFKICKYGQLDAFSFRNKENFKDCTNISNSESYYDKLEKIFNLEKLNLTGDDEKVRDLQHYYTEMFDALFDAVNYRPAYKKFHYQMLQEMYDDNIMYAEIRTEIWELYGKNKKTYPRNVTVETLIKVVEKFKKTHEDFLGVKFIFAIELFKGISMEFVQSEFEVFKELQKSYPEYIIGLDFVGLEDYREPIKQYLNDLIQLKNDGYKFYFLAGSTNRQGVASDFNLYDALLLQTRRIGHGYALWKHPIVMDEVISKSIPIEICPVSNQINGLVWDLRNHPGGIYISENASLVIGSDSPGFLGTTGLSTDFYYTIMSLASNKADLRTLKQLVLNSISYSAISESSIPYARYLFTKKWEEFLDYVVDEYNVQSNVTRITN